MVRPIRVKQSNWGDRYTTRYPQTRMGVEEILRDTFLAGRDYEKSWIEYRRQPPGTAPPPRRDLRMEAAVEILNRQRVIHVHSYGIDSESVAGAGHRQPGERAALVPLGGLGRRLRKPRKAPGRRRPFLHRQRWVGVQRGARAQPSPPGRASRRLRAAARRSTQVHHGDPLEITTQMEAAYIDGRPLDLSNRQSRRYEKY